MSELRRPFRGAESLEQEEITREAIAPFLAVRGYVTLKDERKRTHFLHVRTPDGQTLKMRVCLCWRRAEGNSKEKKYAAAQLRESLVNGSWNETLEFLVERDLREGNTYNLIVQRDGADIVYAVPIQREELPAIWRRQRARECELNREGAVGQAKKEPRHERIKSLDLAAG
ncbi:hypothetical protein [Paraburkholderia largidicola]|nr:hypothetical protein [Paraburkholderia sp. PGU16]